MEARSIEPRIIVALDSPDLKDIHRLIGQLDPKLCRLKVGKLLFTRYGPELVKQCIKEGYEVFLDLKFHDIPHQVAQACAAAADLGVWMLTVHTLGGKKMLEAARAALGHSQQAPLLVGVTLLTSLDQTDLIEIGITSSLSQMVLRLARLAYTTGLDGVVCSAQEATSIRAIVKDTFYLITPGIRFSAVNNDDQARVATPRQALSYGADYLVIGRPITESVDPLHTLQTIAIDLNDSNR